MAEQIVSPGVFTRENDQSFITQQPVEVGAAIIGPTVLGPVEIPTLVTSWSEYLNTFGSTFISSSQTYSFMTSLSAYNYFQNGGNTLLVTRVASGSFSPASTTGSNAITDRSATTLETSLLVSSIVGAVSGAVATYTDVSSSVVNGSSVTASFVFDTETSVSGITSVTGNGSFAIGDTFIFPSASLGGSGASLLDLTLTLVAADITNPQSNVPFILKTHAEGAVMNSTSTVASDGSLPSGSVNNLRWEITSANTGSGVFTLNIRRGNDTTNEKVILETFANISLDPEQDNYVAKVIGDTYKQVTTNGADTFIQTIGDYPKGSRYVYVSEVLKPTPNYFDNSGIAQSSYTSSIPAVQSAAFGDATGSILPVGAAQYYNNISNTDTQGLSATNYTTAVALLANKDEYQYNVITAPGLVFNFSSHVSTLNTLIANTQNRGDAISVIDIVGYGSTVSAAANTANGLNSSYAATYWPWCQVNNPDTGKLNWIPASALIPGVYAFNDASSEPWFAPAGINRGGLSTVVRPERKLQRSDRDTLYENNVNPIANFPATGTVVFGQKTLQRKASALDRVNVRRLLIALKSYIGQVANNLVFEQNSIATRNSFLAQVNPYLESVQQRQGVYAFKVVMNETNNTPDVIDRNEMVGQIFLQPTRTAEFIILDFNVLPTGAEFPA
jgi:uncharacterized protein